jgi:hypothetical protein
VGVTAEESTTRGLVEAVEDHLAKEAQKVGEDRRRG